MSRPICHAPWVLASAGIARGHTLTSFHTIADDMRNAGAHWVNQEACVDDNIVTSRKPGDIHAFNREFIKMLSSGPVQTLTSQESETASETRG
jgi:protease I